mmetsp:Transcript_26512/g.40856  ORF Transcript_26512/g.40856 Transcript_26512/m.40856 type:complete len:175 (+) Transcript_26512:152-676(+)
MKKAHGLQPEHERVINDLSRKLSAPISYSMVHTLTTEIWEKGCFKFFKEPVTAKNIPSGTDWRWNQTKSTVCGTLGTDVEVMLHKLIPRKKPSITGKLQLPSLKIWRMEIKHKASTEPHLHVLYCEKGITFSSTLKFCEMHLDQFSFLGEFMDAEVANEFWPNTIEYSPVNHST